MEQNIRSFFAPSQQLSTDSQSSNELQSSGEGEHSKSRSENEQENAHVAESSTSLHFRKLSQEERPACWSSAQFANFFDKNPWLFAEKGCLGCSTCRKVKSIKFSNVPGLQISIPWVRGNVTYSGTELKNQQSSLRSKIKKHKESEAHKEALSILRKAEKKILEASTDKQVEFALQSTKKIFRTAYYIAKKHKPFSDFSDIVDLQAANSVDMGRVLHSRTTVVNIIEHISTEMKKDVISNLIQKKSKINILIDEATRIGNKETLIVFIKASVDGINAPISFPLDLIELEKTDAVSIKNDLIKCLGHYGLKKEVLQKCLIGFCSDGANVMMGAKSGVGKLLKEEFPNILIWLYNTVSP